MANSKTKIVEVFSQLSPDNQRTLLLCARTAKVAENTVKSQSLGIVKKPDYILWRD